MNEKILIVDDEPDILDTLEALLASERFHVRKASEGKQALEIFQSEAFDLVITDIRMPGIDGLEVIKHLKHLDQDVEIIVLSGFVTIDNAIEALQDGGAFDFLRKPLENLDGFFNTIYQALEKRRLRIQNRMLLEQLRTHQDHLEELVSRRTAELMKANEHLRQEITERRHTEEALQRAKEAAEIADRAKSDFLANMSHELRTPLNHIIGFTELVADQHFGALNETQAEYLQDVLSSSQHLLALINDILDLSKVEVGKLELHPSKMYLETLLEHSLIMIKEKALKQKITLTTDIEEIPETIIADERKLKQILYNLLSNAVKFTPDSGEICLSANCVAGSELRVPGFSQHPTGEFIRISVSDTGIGLKQENLERIVHPFEQVEHSTSRRFQGTGLGLSLTKCLVELHGGRIWAESEGEGKGSTFIFIIPMYSNPK